jgi:hypothetical protein
MRRGSTIIILAVSIVMLAAIGAASAQTTANLYTVKFVCGTQAPNGSTAPSEPPVKPGNYATTIDIENLSGKVQYTWSVSLAGAAGPTSSVGGTLGAVNTADVYCAAISRLVGSSSPFITGFVNIQTPTPLVVTAVYTSQGCVFVPGVKPLCGGRTHIDVQPQQAVSTPPPPPPPNG